MGNLTALTVKNATAAGRYIDGAGLSLVVKPTGSRSWVLRLQVAGRRRDFGLGSANHVKLAEAREAADVVRRQFRAGLDPVAERKKLHAAPSPTFRQAAERLHEELKPSWRNGKHREDWLSSVKRHAYPKLGRFPVDQIDGPMIRDALLPIWLDVPETARRVRQRIGAVLDWAHSNGYREAEAPLRSVTKGLPRQTAPRGHFTAMAYPLLPGFYAELLAGEETMGRLALRFAILTAARSGEVRGASWAEIDLEARAWTIPATRMKAKVAHRVPLSSPAIELLRPLAANKSGPLIFFGRSKVPLSDMTLSKVVRDSAFAGALRQAEVERGGIGSDAAIPTVHGFRSTFRDWVAEQTSTPGEIAEAALAHVVKNPTERAYHRTRYFEKRQPLMEGWASFVTSGQSNVVPLKAVL